MQKKGLIYWFEVHYEKTPIQIFNLKQLKNNRMKNSEIFHISAQNIGCDTRRGGSNEYPQCMF